MAENKDKASHDRSLKTKLETQSGDKLGTTSPRDFTVQKLGETAEQGHLLQLFNH